MLRLAQNIIAIYRHRELVKEMTVRDIKGFTKGMVLGISWVIISPLIQVTAYAMIVSFVFRARLSPDAGPMDYAAYVLSGMIPWQILTRSISEAPMLIRGNTELVKQVIYPIETLPLTKIIVSAFGSLVSLIALVALMVFSVNLRWTIVLLPVPLFFILLLILGLSWFFSIAGVILKDLREAITIFMGMIVYASPAIVSETMVGSRVWKIIMLNPFAHVVISFRDVFWAQFHPMSWAIFITMAVSFFLLGNWTMIRAKTLISEYI